MYVSRLVNRPVCEIAERGQEFTIRDFRPTLESP